MKQEGSARRRGADKAKPPPGGGEQEPPPPPGPQDVEMKEEAATGGGSTGEADGKTAVAAEHSQRELDTITLEGTRAWAGDVPRLRVTATRGSDFLGPQRSLHHPLFVRITPVQVSAPTALTLLSPAPVTPGSGLTWPHLPHPGLHLELGLTGSVNSLSFVLRLTRSHLHLTRLTLSRLDR